MTTTLKPMQTSILGTLVMELLNGELSEETIAAVDSLKREDVPGTFNDIVGYMHGMSTYPPLMEGQITSLITELGGAVSEVLEKRRGGPPPQDSWGPMQSFFFDIFESSYVDDMIEEEIEILPDPEMAQGWTAPLITHAKSTKSRGKKLMLELLDILEDMIQKRRAELKQDAP